MSEQQAREIPRAALELLEARAEADFPEETCGFLFAAAPGDKDSLLVVPMENIQNRLHEEDPQNHPRDARTAYCFDPKAMLQVLAEQEKARRPLWGIYHSHPDHDAYFSATDSAAAAPFGEPSYPGVVYLVLSVRDGKAVATKAFDWGPSEESFVEVPLRVVG